MHREAISTQDLLDGKVDTAGRLTPEQLAYAQSAEHAKDVVQKATALTMASPPAASGPKVLPHLVVAQTKAKKGKSASTKAKKGKSTAMKAQPAASSGKKPKASKLTKRQLQKEGLQHLADDEPGVHLLVSQLQI